MANTEVGTAHIGLYPKVDPSAASSCGSTLGSALNAGVAKIGLGTAIGSIISKGISAATSTISSSISGAINRVDILNNYPKVMVSLGYSADAAAASISKISDHLTGLPSSTDALASFVQQIAATTGSIEKSTDVGLAFNDMMLAGGKGSQAAESAMYQFNQILAKGKPEMQDWMTLVQTAPGQMKQLAQAMLGPTATADDLYKALGGGKNEATKSMDDLMNAIVQLDSEGGDGFSSFADQAKAATGGIGTSLENLNTALIRAGATVLETIGVENITGAISQISNAIKSIGEVVNVFVQSVKGTLENSGITSVIDNFKNAWTEALPEIKADMTALGNAVGTVIAFIVNNMPTIIPIVKAAISVFIGFKAAMLIQGAIAKTKAALALLGISLKGVGAGFSSITAKAKPATTALAKVDKPLQTAGKSAKVTATSFLKAAAGVALIGVGIIAAAAGFQLMANAAISLANAGAPAIAVFFGMIAAIALLAATVAIAGTSMITGAVGFLIFGAAITLIGAGIAIASAGIALLATQLPIIAMYGAQAALNFASFAVGLLALAPTLILVGASLVVLAAGAVVATVGIVLLAVGIAALGVATLVLAAGLLVGAAAVSVLAAALPIAASGSFSLSTGLTLAAAGALLVSVSAIAAGAGLIVLGAGALIASAGLVVLTAGALLSSVGLVALTLSVTLLSAATLILGAAITVLAAGFIALAAGVVLAGAGFLIMATAMPIIANTAPTAAAGLAGILVAVTGLIPMLMACGPNVEGFGRSMSSASGSILSGASAMGQASSNAGSLTYAMSGAASSAMYTGASFNAFGSMVSSAMSSASSSAQSAAATITSAISTAMTTIQTITSVSCAQMSVSLQTLPSAAQNAANGITSAFNSISSAMQSTVSTVQNGMSQIADSVNNTHLTIPTIKVEKLPHFKINGSLNLETGQVPNIDVSYYASGGVFKHAAVFGEAGREAVIPLNRTALRPFAQGIAEELGGSRGIVVNVNNAEVNSRPEMEKAAYNLLMELRRLGYMQGGAK